MKSTARVLLLALADLLAACGGGSTVAAPPTLGPRASDTPVAASTQLISPTAIAAPSATSLPTAGIPPTAMISSATSQAAAANLLISYHKSGGIAGINETLSVYADGTIELRDKRGTTSTQASPNDIQALQKLLVSPEFAALQAPMRPPGADQFIYELTVAGRAQPIVTVDGVDNPPVAARGDQRAGAAEEAGQIALGSDRRGQLAERPISPTNNLFLARPRLT